MLSQYQKNVVIGIVFIFILWASYRPMRGTAERFRFMLPLISAIVLLPDFERNFKILFLLISGVSYLYSLSVCKFYPGLVKFLYRPWTKFVRLLNAVCFLLFIAHLLLCLETYRCRSLEPREWALLCSIGEPLLHYFNTEVPNKLVTIETSDLLGPKNEIVFWVKINLCQYLEVFFEWKNSSE